MEQRIKIKQTRSPIGHTSRQRATLQALGLGKVGSCVEHGQTPAVAGMLRAVAHLVEVEYLAGQANRS